MTAAPVERTTIAALLAGLLAGCGSGAAPCTEGESRVCSCPSGSGTQICRARSYGPCACAGSNVPVATTIVVPDAGATCDPSGHWAMTARFSGQKDSVELALLVMPTREVRVLVGDANGSVSLAGATPTTAGCEYVFTASASVFSGGHHGSRSTATYNVHASADGVIRGKVRRVDEFLDLEVNKVESSQTNDGEVGGTLRPLVALDTSVDTDLIRQDFETRILEILKTRCTTGVFDKRARTMKAAIALKATGGIESIVLDGKRIDLDACDREDLVQEINSMPANPSGKAAVVEFSFSYDGS